MKNKLKIAIHSLILSLLIPFFASCSSAPGVPNSSIDDFLDVTASLIDSVQSVTKAMERFSPEQEYMLGLSVANSICKVYTIAEQTTAGDYLNKICTTLTINSLFPYSFKGYHVILVHSDDLNAISTPGGHIFITDSLLKICTSEDEVAAVIAHELAHIQLKHSINLIRTKRGTKAFQDVTSSATKIKAMKDDDFKMIATAMDENTSAITDTLFNTGFSKAQEFDADKTALKLLYDAGYNPEAMTKLLEHLKENQPSKAKKHKREKKHSRHVRGSGLMDFNSFNPMEELTTKIEAMNKTHPSPKKRIQKIEKHIYEYHGKFYEKKRQQRFEANKVWF